ncbi:MAG: peptide chain release factor N(5)-glutamine methyltransferase, partial [Steroidobacteraceae bacterium]
VENPAVLDLGTGSGAVAIAIASERPDAAMTATDLSPAALAVARRNADRHGIPSLRLVEGSWFEPLAGERFEAIVSNPPYVPAGDPALAALASEPRLALVAGASGLEAIACIVAGAAAHLAPGGRLLLEHGATQGAPVRELFRSTGFEGVATRCDLAGQERVTEGTRVR